MGRVLRGRLVRLWRCEDGATLVEYGIAVALAVAIGTAGIATILSGEISSALGSAGAEMPD